VKLAEKRADAAERAQREVINETGRKLQDASNALKNAQARIEAAEDQLTALEFRAQSAEAQLHDAKQALLQVEEAIPHLASRPMAGSPRIIARPTTRSPCPKGANMRHMHRSK
jgi:chromosome segregation ATPase